MNRAVFASALILLGCARTNIAIPAPSNQRTVLDIVRQALDSDAAGIPADTLYLPTATVVRDGAEHSTGRRFAAVGDGGQVRIASMTGDVTGSFAWAYVTYRWMSGDGAFIETARASIILAEQDGVWKIRHAHSSLMLPWQRDD